MKPCLLIPLLGLACATVRPPETSSAEARAGIAAFNQALDDATRKMDNAASLALWEEDGISLLPQTKPMVGKKAIAAFLDGVMAQLASAKMTSFESECFDLEVAGDWASEWCTEHQIVALGDGKTFDGRGKMLFVLHRGRDGKWRIQREMWNQAG
jgi:uncharacterized protein (TIGR02246 family)